MLALLELFGCRELLVSLLNRPEIKKKVKIAKLLKLRLGQNETNSA